MRCLNFGDFKDIYYSKLHSADRLTRDSDMDEVSGLSE